MAELINGLIPVAERLPGEWYLLHIEDDWYCTAKWQDGRWIVDDEGTEVLRQIVIGCIPLSALVPRSELDEARAIAARWAASSGQLQAEAERMRSELDAALAEVERLRDELRVQLGLFKDLCQRIGVDTSGEFDADEIVDRAAVLMATEAEVERLRARLEAETVRPTTEEAAPICRELRGPLEVPVPGLPPICRHRIESAPTEQADMALDGMTAIRPKSPTCLHTRRKHPPQDAPEAGEVEE